MVTQNGPEPPRVVGRYMLFDEIAAGGMATVRYGRLIGEVGFSRTVAVKCLHAHFAKDEEFAKMFLDEARLAARVRHPNVVPILDVVARDGELFLVMDYVQGESLSKLIRATRARKSRIPLRIVASIMAGVLDGLHAAHEAKSEHGEPLGIVHRDVSPQNVIVGLDGVSRVLDFGVAKAAGRMQSTRNGQLKGKLAYMAPEQLKSEWVDRRTDIYAASVVLWEALTGTRLFKADDEVGVFGMVLQGKIAPPSSVIPSIPKGYDDVTMRGLHLDPGHRFATARDMATALEKVAGVASPREVSGWVEELARDTLRKRADKIAELESVSTLSVQAMIARGSTGEPPGVSIAPVPSGPVSAHAPPPPRPGLPPPRVPPPPRRSAPGVGSTSGVHAPVSITQVSSEVDDDAMTIISDTTASSVALSTAAGMAPAVQLQEPVSSPSQMTSLSMAQEPPRAGPKPRVLMAVIAVALVLSSLAVAGVVVISGMLNPKGAGLPDAGPASGTLAEGKEDADPLDVVFVEADASPDGSATVADAAADVRAEASAAGTVKRPPPPGTVRVPPSSTTADVKPPPTQTAVRPPPAETTSKPPKGDCNPPYTIDARGVRVPKIHCL